MAQPVWNTPVGSLGKFPAQLYFERQLSAKAILPATSLEYFLLSGSLPTGMSLNINGLIYGIPEINPAVTNYEFTVRVVDNYNNFKDRYFFIEISGSGSPFITESSGQIAKIFDSIWLETRVDYANPKSDNPINFSIIAGSLPEGLEMNTAGIIRGYAKAPTTEVTLPAITTNATATVQYNALQPTNSNYIICQSTIGFTVGRPVVFTTNLANIEAAKVYYIKRIVSSVRFTISEVQFGPEYLLTQGSNLSAVTLLPFRANQPVIKSSSFTVLLESPLGNDQKEFSVTVINQELSVRQGGLGVIRGNRTPVVLNTRPETFKISDDDKFYGYYLLPKPDDFTFPPTQVVDVGTYKSDNYFAFKIIGKSFDNAQITYVFKNLPSQLRGDATTGWITGNLNLTQSGVNKFNFSVSVCLSRTTTITSDTFNFSLIVTKEMTEIVTWVTPNDLGSIPNGTLSSLYIEASADVGLSYEIVGGQLPPNLQMDSLGQITGYVAYQPTEQFLTANDISMFTFDVRAYSSQFPAITDTKTFTLSVVQDFANPTDTLYVKATPSESDRLLIDSLLNNESIIPTEYLFRPYDIYFGKARDVIYEHAYGIYANELQAYIDAEEFNHYWRNITLGQIEIAQAKDSNGNVLYEVVYSKVIDDLVNSKSQSVPKEIRWPVPINLNLGPWITSEEEIFTSYTQIQNQSFYTSLSQGRAVVLYPNSLPNMRKQIGEVLGQEFNTDILPLWMRSQQADGNTLGFTPAWVICYCKPGKITRLDGTSISYAEQVKINIETNWRDERGNVLKLNKINFQLDRFSVDKSLTYNYSNKTNPPSWNSLPSATPVPEPLDSKNFNVLFPRKTILPNKSQL